MHKLDISKASGKFLGTLPSKQFRQIVLKILALRQNPEPHDAQSLKGYSEYSRVDVGEYRIVYRVANDTVIISLVGKRNDDDIYKRMRRKL